MANGGKRLGKGVLVVGSREKRWGAEGHTNSRLTVWTLSPLLTELYLGDRDIAQLIQRECLSRARDHALFLSSFGAQASPGTPQAHVNMQER